MVCKTISTNIRTGKSKRQRSAFTLVEMLVAMGIGGLIVGVVAGLTVYSARSFASLYNYVDLDEKSRTTLDRMTADIRQADSLQSISTSNDKIVLNYSGGNTIGYLWQTNTGKVFRQVNGANDPPNALLEGCDWLEFSIYQRNPVGGTYDQYPTASPATCKLIQVSWTCSREILGSKINTESVQSAKIVIRSQ